MPFNPNAISQGLATGASIPNRNTGLSELIRTITRDLTNAKAERIKNQQKTTDQRIELLKVALAGGYQGNINSFMQTGDLSAFKPMQGVMPPSNYRPTYKVNEYGRTMLSGYEPPPMIPEGAIKQAGTRSAIGHIADFLTPWKTQNETRVENLRERYIGQYTGGQPQNSIREQYNQLRANGISAEQAKRQLGL